MTQPLPQDIARMLDEAADLNGLPSALVRAVAWVESKGDARAMSPKGAKGVMQLMPVVETLMRVRDVWDPAQNIAGGVRFLATLIERYGETYGLAAYNAGASKVIDKPIEQWPQETRKYVASVQERRKLEPLTAAGDVAHSERLSLQIGLLAFLSAQVLTAALAFTWSHKGGHV